MRRPWLDVLKGAAMALVVLNHAVIWPMRAGDATSAFVYGIAYGTVAAFAAVTGYIAGMRPPAEKPGAVIRRRAHQLLLPWVFWVAVYALGPVAWGALGLAVKLPSHFESGPWIRALLLGGGPLWFLPVIFVACVVGVLLDRRVSGWWPAWVLVGAYCVVAVLAAAAGRSPLALGDSTVWPVSPLYVASYWAGLRFARDGVPRALRVVAWPTLLLTAALSGVVASVRAETGATALMWLAYGLGVPNGWAALAIVATRSDAPRGAAARVLERAGVASRGVYVLHPLVIAPLMLGASVLLPAGLWLLVAAVVVAGAGVWITTLVAEAARRTRHGHALV